jgi:hypothetical protein
LGGGVKVLLDENLPHALRSELSGHDVFTVQFMGWSSVRNGQLLARAATSGFDVLVTGDAGIAQQQNLATLPLSVVVLSAKSNRVSDLRPLVPRLL